MGKWNVRKHLQDPLRPSKATFLNQVPDLDLGPPDTRQNPITNLLTLSWRATKKRASGIDPKVGTKPEKLYSDDKDCLGHPEVFPGCWIQKIYVWQVLVVDVAIPSIKRVRGYRAAANLHHINFKAWVTTPMSSENTSFTNDQHECIGFLNQP